MMESSTLGRTEENAKDRPSKVMGSRPIGGRDL
jgi:hypothetical protein